MKFFTVHENLHRRDPDERILLVKEGFIWPAFFVPLLWLVYKRAWIGLLLYAAAAILLLGLLSFAGLHPAVIGVAAGAFLFGAPALLGFGPAPILTAIGLLFAVLCGYEAGDALRFTLARRGYRPIAIVSGRSLIEAEQAYFMAHPQAGAAGSSGPKGPWSPGGSKGGGGPAADQAAARRAGQWASASEPILGLFPGPDHRG
jgi:Protein of unknown function (DUF2628)